MGPELVNLDARRLVPNHSAYPRIRRRESEVPSIDCPRKLTKGNNLLVVRSSQEMVKDPVPLSSASVDLR